jgi:hypothetical protein
MSLVKKELVVKSGNRLLKSLAAKIGNKEVFRLPDLEHPSITQVNKTGYANLVAQEEHAGTDFHGNEVLTGDSIVLLPNGEVVQEEDLEDYLIEVLGYRFTTAD